MLWLVIVLLLFIFQIITILVSEFRHPSKAMAWLMILFVFPLIGFIMYYFLAKEYTQRKIVQRKKGYKMLDELKRELVRQSRSIKIEKDKYSGTILEEPRLFALLYSIPGSPITQHNEVTVLKNAASTYTSMMEEIEKAEDHIHFEFYTIRHDEIGKQFQRLLIRKALQGVKVRVIFDGIGSYKLSGFYVNELKKAGVEVYCFLPVLFAFFDKRMNYRNHRKILIVDGKIGFLGGMNIGDEYLGGNPKLGFWRDTHLKLEGDSVYYLQQTFLTDWSFVSNQKLSDSKYFPEHQCPGTKAVQVIPSGPDGEWDFILESIFGGITTAKKRIYITSPYFIPNEAILMGLKTAAMSGVDVKIIIPGVNDSRIVQYANLSYVQELLDSGVEMYQYQRGFIHAKIIIVDTLFASVGSANMDVRSFYNNFEINALLFDKVTIERLHKDFINDLKDSIQIIPSQFEKRPRFQKVKEAMAHMIDPLF